LCSNGGVSNNIFAIVIGLLNPVTNIFGILQVTHKRFALLCIADLCRLKMCDKNIGGGNVSLTARGSTSLATIQTALLERRIGLLLRGKESRQISRANNITADSKTLTHMMRSDCAAFRIGNYATGCAVQRFRSLIIVDRLVAMRFANSFWVNLLNVLRHVADMRLLGVVALVLKGIDWQAIMGRTNALNVFLKPCIGEKRLRCRLRCCGSR